MLLIAYKRVDNVATMRVRATSTHAAEISFLICEQMEKADYGSRRPPVPHVDPPESGWNAAIRHSPFDRATLDPELEV